MEEQKRLFIAIILSIVIIVGWNTFFVSDQKVIDPLETAQETSPGSTVENISPTAGQLKGNAVEANAVAQPNLKKENARLLSVETPLYDISISEYGASVTSFTLKNYRETVETDAPFKQLIPPGLDVGLFSVDFEGKTIPGLEDAVFTARTDNLQNRLNHGEKVIVFSWDSPHGITVEKIFTFSANTYLVEMDVVVKNTSSMPLKDALKICLPHRMDQDKSGAARFGANGPVAFINNKLEEIDSDDIEEKDTFTGKIDWVGNSGRYFISALVPATPWDAQFKLAMDGDLITSSYIKSMDRIDPGQQATLSFELYMGPKSLKILSAYDNTLKKSINFGWFDILAKPCLIGMNLIHDIIPNYGIAIILLTLLIKILFWPLGSKSYKSMSDMKRLQPLMMELREKYKDDKQRMNQEVMGLYKTYKVNPMSGCLPMLVQMPIFFALYRMLYQAIELRHAPFMGWITDLSAPDRLLSFDFAIPFMQAPYGIPVLTIIMGASMFLQQKMSPTTGDPTQAKMMMLMPLFMTFIFINFPAGLVLYWLVNNLLSIGQQYYIQRKFA
ncbi:protein translocase subunit yidC [Desulfocicer vacuolatum DSM 3385]|uniref:Membrane protein insertase YidC n=1 Tax=Desulfocicer vacuolatum DSM 3385 TaxID=1121400 RepID=A0A1W1ZSN8_9BACT|nr:membrane protein insertase YidC [Desulfocicer vacuolatum]SMC51363.1 protein translocase subunit yidC [Desulfocicer vacuolatum DSM 3385]